MKRSDLMSSGLFVYGGTALLTLAFGAILKWAVGQDDPSYIRSFFLRCWYIQLLNTWLFFVSIFYWLRRYILFRAEEKVFQEIKLPDFSIERSKVLNLIDKIPKEYKHTLTLRRFRELLQAFLYGEDLIRLNEELSRRDVSDVDRGHLVLNSIRNIMPIIGFLGTVLGLSIGIVHFPDTTDVVALRSALKSFAASLSVAFDTTLLALAYTVGITLLISYLRNGEEVLVGQVDERARLLLERIKYEHQKTGLTGETHMQDSTKDTEIAKDIGVAVRESLKVLIQKMDDIKTELRHPSRYQVIVETIKGEGTNQHAE